MEKVQDNTRKFRMLLLDYDNQLTKKFFNSQTLIETFEKGNLIKTLEVNTFFKTLYSIEI